MSIIGKIKDRAIQSSMTVLQSLKKMDEAKVKMLFVFEKEQFLSILTIGDIQRAIIKQVNLSDSVLSILETNKAFASLNESKNIIREKMLRLRAECMPVVDDAGNLVDVYFWNDFFKQSEGEHREKIDLPVVIMAGGKGTRLKPITNVIPKPLVPVGDKTIADHGQGRSLLTTHRPHPATTGYIQGRGDCGVNTHQPIRLGASLGRLIDMVIFRPRLQLLEALLDRFVSQ